MHVYLVVLVKGTLAEQCKDKHVFVSSTQDNKSGAEWFCPQQRTISLWRRHLDNRWALVHQLSRKLLLENALNLVSFH